MTFFYPRVDILDFEADVYVCPVNCAGTMGKGLAKRFALKYEGLKEAYREACREKLVLPSITWEYRAAEGPFIACVATKRHWSMRSTIKDIDSALMGLAIYFSRKDPDLTVALPAIGCGLGGLTWEIVQPRIEYRLRDCAQPIHVFEPPYKGGARA